MRNTYNREVARKKRDQVAASGFAMAGVAGMSAIATAAGMPAWIIGACGLACGAAVLWFLSNVADIDG